LPGEPIDPSQSENNAENYEEILMRTQDLPPQEMEAAAQMGDRIT